MKSRMVQISDRVQRISRGRFCYLFPSLDGKLIFIIHFDLLKLCLLNN